MKKHQKCKKAKNIKNKDFNNSAIFQARNMKFSPKILDKF